MAAHHRKTTGFVLAPSRPCVDIREEEVRAIHRNLRPVGVEDLPRLRLPASWILAAIVCPGDDLRPLAEWAGALARDAVDRVRLYAHPDVDLVDALAPWYAAGLDDPLTAEAEDFVTFHKQFGWDFNNQVYRDHTRARP